MGLRHQSRPPQVRGKNSFPRKNRTRGICRAAHLQRALIRVMFFSQVRRDARVFRVARIWHGRQDPASLELWPFVQPGFPSQNGDDTRPAGSSG